MSTILTQKGSRLNATVSGLDVYIEGSDGIHYEVEAFYFDTGMVVFKDKHALILTDLQSKLVMQELLREAFAKADIFLKDL